MSSEVADPTRLPAVGVAKSRRVSRVAAIVLVIAGLASAGAALLWTQVIRDRIYPHNFGVVEAGRIYRSGQISAPLIKKVLQDNKIKVVVALSVDHPESPDTTAEKQIASELGIQRLEFSLAGNGTGDAEHYVQAIAAMDQAAKDAHPVLVHCEAGAQRTGGVVALYRILVEKVPVSQAYGEMVRYGFDPRRNPHLLPYLNEHMGQIAARLVQMKVIDKIPDPLPVIQAEQ